MDVTGWQALDPEALGTNPHKRWLLDPDGRPWPFKPVTRQRQGGTTFAKGDDWAEKVVGDLARALRRPAATIELAHLGSQPGIISRDMRGGRSASIRPIRDSRWRRTPAGRAAATSTEHQACWTLAVAAARLAGPAVTGVLRSRLEELDEATFLAHTQRVPEIKMSQEEFQYLRRVLDLPHFQPFVSFPACTTRTGPWRSSRNRSWTPGRTW